MREQEQTKSADDSRYFLAVGRNWTSLLILDTNSTLNPYKEEPGWVIGYILLSEGAVKVVKFRGEKLMK